MLVLLIFISFVLHAVSFYWILSLKKRLKETSEIEDVLAVYLEDMKEQNDEWIGAVKALHKPETEEERAPALDPVAVKGNEEPEKPISDYRPLDIPPQENKGDFSFEGQVLSLHAQGLDHEEIAKKLGRGKGEVELLLRLAESKKG